MRKHILSVVVCLLVAGAVLAQGADSTKMAPKKKAMSKAVVWPAADIKWTDISADNPGAKIADLWGDHTKGAFGALIKFPAGFSAPMHTHTANMRLVYIAGTVIHGPEGKPEVKLGPGSYLKQPGGSYRHTTKCDAGAECMFFVESDGKFDLIPAEEAKK